MSAVNDILGCPLLEITRSWWAVKLKSGKYRCQRQKVHNWREGSERYLDWYEDIAATSDCRNITELWLFCPPNHYSLTGNTARLKLSRPRSSFQCNIGTADGFVAGPTKQTHQAQIIGRVETDEGDCTCFAWDRVMNGLVTHETTVYDRVLKGPKMNDDGTVFYPMKTNILRFGWRVKDGKLANGMWRDSLAPPGLLAYDRLGITLPLLAWE